MDAAGNEVVAGAFRRAAGQDRGLIFGKTQIPHFLADLFDEFGTHHDLLVEIVPAQVQEPVFETHGFRCIFILDDLEGDLFGFAENIHRIRHQFDLTGGKFGIDRFRGAGDNRAGEAEARFRTPAFQFLIEIHFGVDDNLSLAVVVAEVNEDHAAVVADAVDPAGDPDLFPDLFLAECAASVRSELMHNFILCIFPETGFLLFLNTIVL